MVKIALAFLLGVYILTMFRALPQWQWILMVFPAVFMAIKRPRYILLSITTIGFCWALFHAHQKYYPDLDASLEGVDLDVTGQIISVPSHRARSIRFEFLIHHAVSAESQNPVSVPKKVRLNWYGKFSQVQLGEQWQLRIRLKRPWGMANPGSFDYEKWLFEHQIRATGYVRAKGVNEQINPVSLNDPTYFLRSEINKRIQAISVLRNDAVIKALVLGEKSELDPNRWQILTATGTNHLLAISGLHVGIISGLIYGLVVFLWKRSETLCLRIAAQRVAALTAIFASFTYAMLAGFSIPTQRAMIMTTIVFLAVYFARTIRRWDILSLALICVLIWDPFSILSPGFWLSFAAVALIFYAVVKSKAPEQSGKILWWFSLGKMQFVLALGLLPLTMVFFQHASIISPIANFFAVPWVSLITVPLVLMASFSLLLSESLALGLFQLADLTIDILFIFLKYLHDLPYAKWQHAAPTWVLIPAVFGVLLILMPRGAPTKILGFVLLMPVFFAQAKPIENGQLRLSILDVGQGLAAVLETKKHVLLYDTGPPFGSNSNAGEAVIVPFMRYRNIDVIDTLIVSHTDKDHAGGVEGVLDNMAVTSLVSSAPHEFEHENSNFCLHGQQWHWDDVEFQFLHPKKEDIDTLSKNNSSCVLLIKHAAGSILITGDIEQPIERLLVENYVNLLDTDILIVPHHGSNSSSTKKFVQATSPEYAVIAAGYRNPYGFPKPKVVSRYNEMGAKLINTATQGMITFSFSSQQGIQLHSGYRHQRKRFWHTSY